MILEDRPCAMRSHGHHRQTPAGHQRLVLNCRTASASNAMCCITHCANYCALCQPLLRAFSRWIQSPPPTMPGTHHNHTPELPAPREVPHMCICFFPICARGIDQDTLRHVGQPLTRTLTGTQATGTQANHLIEAGPSKTNVKSFPTNSLFKSLHWMRQASSGARLGGSGPDGGVFLWR